MRAVTLAATQMASTWDLAANLAQAEALVRDAAARGGQIILLPELFETPYFCQDRLGRWLALATPIAENPAVQLGQRLARELRVVLPISVFERAGQNFFNTVAVIDADGTVLGTYRKSHIPDSPGYSEKFYFSPGDTGFRVWRTAYATIGVGICWDQWFPETHRAMALMGAEVLAFPTAIGSEPSLPELDCSGHWQRTMQGQAGANVMPLVASNRIGIETGQEGTSMTFFGHSFIADHTGDKLCDAGRDTAGVLLHTFDLEAIAEHRAFWGTFRDRRPDLYAPLLTFDGAHRHAAGA